MKFSMPVSPSPSLIEQLAIRLMKQLAIPLSNPKTVAKWLVISPQAGKSLVIPRKRGKEIRSDGATSHSTRPGKNAGQVDGYRYASFTTMKVSMYKLLARLGMIVGLAFSRIDSSYALDSYRFLHVTIETPWAIFIFLLFTIFAPFILMAVLAWRFAERKVIPEKDSPVKTEGKE